MLHPEKPLTSTGLVMPPDFPRRQYESVYARVQKSQAGSEAFRHFGGAFNALSYRYRAAHDDAVAFQRRLQSEGSSPPPEPRYEQERLLFNFYSNCFSVLEAYFFALFAFSHMLKPREFALATPEDEQKVSPASTLKLLGKHFSCDPIVPALTSLTQLDEYKALRGVRNVLTHRTAPGRLMYVSIGDDAPATEWKLDGKSMTEDMLTRRTAELATLFRAAMVELDKFTEIHMN